jgi:phage terminase large subunit-like protein
VANLNDAMRWSPEAQARAARRIEAVRRGDLQVFYCKDDGSKRYGRRCDGLPHDGYPYNHARGDQWPPAGTNWRVWALTGGRGSGKTRTGSEYTIRVADKVGRIGLIGRTQADAIDTMVEGVSGILYTAERAGIGVEYQRSRARLVFDNGCIATLFSGEKPAKLRGPQHTFLWYDEPAHYDNIDEMWAQGMFGLRLPADVRPHVMVTTTPLPITWMKELVNAPDTIQSKMSTYANSANLSPDFIRDIEREYGNSRMGRQELLGELLLDVPGALWTDELLDGHRISIDKPRPSYDRIIVGVDPAGTANRRSDETGIITVGKADDQFDVLNDRTGKYSPQEWANEVLREYERAQADAIVVENNFGGDMVKATIESEAKRQNITARVLVRRATRGKELRAEPVVVRYEQGRVHHIREHDLSKLETEMAQWVPGKGDSPNRVDALVWAITELDARSGTATFASPANFTPKLPMPAVLRDRLALPGRAPIR